MDFQADFLDEFDRLYDEHLRDRLHPALTNLKQALSALIENKFGVSQRLRLHLDQGRIKSANRLLLKAQTTNYRPLINTPADVFVAIRDIVGTRITCNTLSDVYAVVDAIKECATNDSPSRTLFKLHDDWEDDYIRIPKDSGYRGVNLVIGVPVPIGGIMQPITCEIQIRTLLQHAWGELTHEDTYKPGVKVPSLVEVLSKRLATTHAVLDEIAQDLRNELERVEHLAVAPEPQRSTVSPSEAEAPSEEVVPLTPPPAVEQAPSEPGLTPGGETTPETPHVEEVAPGDVSAAFDMAFGRRPTIDAKGLEAMATELKAAGFRTAADVAAALRESSDRIDEIEATYDKVRLTDLGRLRGAIKFREGPETGVQWVNEVLDRVAEQSASEQEFSAAYPEGREALGTVVRVAWDYALVQLPEGDTGILHVSNMKKYEYEYVDVSDLVNEGDTVRVRVLKADAKRKRIELQLIRQEPSG